jgi:hypothetical protein
MEPLRTVRAMARPLALAEEIRAHGVHSVDGRPIPNAKKLFAGAVPVLLDQVCDWWNTTPVSEGVVQVDIRDPGRMSAGRPWPDNRLEPFARLPWPIVWAEWIDTDSKNLEIAKSLGYPTLRMGALLREGAPAGPFSDCERSVIATCFCHVDGHPARCLGVLCWGAYADGKPKTKDGDALGGWLLASPNGSGQLETAVWEVLGVWRLFTALLSVKGTEAVDTPIPRHVRRQWARLPDSSPPWVTYKSLSIRLAGESESVSRGRVDGPPPGVPLHLVRGYIADYRKGNGLFGKHKQLVWVSSHLRGHARLGAIAKTYDASVARTSQPEPAST